jgi:hypothetical protein
VDYLEAPSFPLSYRVGMFHCADVLIHCPINEGLNLLPMEYVFCRMDWLFMEVGDAVTQTACWFCWSLLLLIVCISPSICAVRKSVID